MKNFVIDEPVLMSKFEATNRSIDEPVHRRNGQRRNGAVDEPVSTNRAPAKSNIREVDWVNWELQELWQIVSDCWNSLQLFYELKTSGWYGIK